MLFYLSLEETLPLKQLAYDWMILQAEELNVRWMGIPTGDDSLHMLLISLEIHFATYLRKSSLARFPTFMIANRDFFSMLKIICFQVALAFKVSCMICL